MTAGKAGAKGDHFSGVSAGYAAFRPRYPAQLFDFVASLAPARDWAWDCGAGSGQATLDLADRFTRVIGSDASAEQIAKAPRDPRIEWITAPAERTPIESGTIDLTIVAQALHWFDHEAFYADVRRVSVPGAAIAAWTYSAPAMEGPVGAVLRRFMLEDIGSFWPPERKHVDDEYRSIPFPFQRVAAPAIKLEYEWTLDQVVGYLRTMSATARYQAARGVDPVIAVAEELRGLWRPNETRKITWPVIVLAGRLSSSLRAR